MTSKDYDVALNYCLVGDCDVGKTSLINRYVEDKFSEEKLPTIAIDFKVKIIHVNGSHIKLSVWDYPHQELFHTIVESYYRGAKGILIVYDVTIMESFENVKKWLQNIRDKASGKLEIFLVANKCDLMDERVVNKEQGERLASDLGLRLFETSAKEGTNVEEAFIAITEDIMNKNTVEELSPAKKNADGQNMLRDKCKIL